MRSVPLPLGGEIRHLRFTFGAVEDIDQLIPGGFVDVFKREAEVRICHLLLWAGLQHEGVTYSEIGLCLVEIPDISPLWKTVSLAFINDEWISIEPKKPDSEKGESKTIGDLILSLEQQAAELGIMPEDFYGLTPREFSMIRESYGLTANRRTGLLCATMANIHAKKPNGRAFEPKDFIRCGLPEKPQTVQDQATVMNAIMGGG